MVVVCPKCDVALILLEFGGVEVDYCPRCEGLWLDSGEIAHLLREFGGAECDPIRDFLELRGRSETGRQPYLCPRCDRPMREIARPAADGTELILDKCPRGDGLWFDRGELLMLLHAMPADVRAAGAITALTEVLGCYINDDTTEGDLK